jgi:hypothetical protein
MNGLVFLSGQTSFKEKRLAVWIRINPELGCLKRNFYGGSNIENRGRIQNGLSIRPDVGFGGNISRSKDIHEVLNVLQLTNAVHFKVEGRRITVMR